MLLPLLLRVLLFCVTVASQPACTRTQTAWRQSPLALLEAPTACSLCGLGAEELLQIDVARLLEPQNAQWVLGAHQYCAGVLNLWAVGVTDDCDTNSSGIAVALALLGDSLQYVCDNVSQWTLLAQVEAYQTALLFNQGQVFGCSACLVNASNATAAPALPQGPSFYYYQEPDVVTLRLLDSNTTLSFSLYQGRYNTILLLTLYALLSMPVICGLLLALVVAQRRNRLYEFGLPANRLASWGDVDTAHLDHAATLSATGDATTASENEMVLSEQTLHDEI